MQQPEKCKYRPPLTHRLPFFYGWIILSMAALTLFLSGPGQTYTVSVFVDPMLHDMGWSRTLVSGLYTAGSLFAAAALVLIGRLLDRYGARIMLVIVALLFGLACQWMGKVDEPRELFLGFIAIRTLGQGSLSLIPTTLLALWFIQRRGKATAIASLGSSASMAAFPSITHVLISTLGWRRTWSILGFAIWGLLLIPALTLVRRSPESVGLHPDGHLHAAQIGDIDLLATPRKEVDWTVGEAFHTKTFWLLMFSGSSQSLIITALVFHQVSLFATKGLDATIAASAITVMAIISLGGNFLAGFLSDRYPNRYILASAQALLILAMLWTFMISNTWGALAYGGILGIAGGLHMTTTYVIWPNYFGRKHLGSIRGIVTTSSVAFAALGPMPFGLLFDLTGNYTTAVIAFLGLPAACALAALLASPPSLKTPPTLLRHN